MTIEEARKLVVDPLYLGCLIIKAGDADGQLAGARNTTGNVLRPALQIIKTAPGITCVSGAMLLLTHAPECGDNGVLVMGDVAVTPVPDANQLAQIAVCTAGTAACVAGLNPRVAMLSFSTKGSAKHEVVDKVVEALAIAKQMAPNLQIDGELQADAALVPSVGASSTWKRSGRSCKRACCAESRSWKHQLQTGSAPWPCNGCRPNSSGHCSSCKRLISRLLR